MALNSRESKTLYPEPESIYVHVPFCKHRCGYCNFPLVANRDYLITDFLDAFEREIEGSSYEGEVDTIFLGGGTPSHLNSEQLARLFAVIRSKFQLRFDGEFTCEVNPNDVNTDLVELLSSEGVNRLSIGAQSFDTNKLKALDRIHTSDEVQRSIELAHPRFKSISIDLIFGIQGETVENWQMELDNFAKTEVQHVSTYELTIEKGTQFWNRSRHEQVKIHEDQNIEMYESTMTCLTRSGFNHYEISSFAQPGHRCRHNQSYWNGNRYLAFGPGAASFVDDKRRTNHASLAEYIRRLQNKETPVAQEEKLSPEQIAAELLVFGIRQIEGVDTTLIERQTGLKVVDLKKNILDELIEYGLLKIENDRIQLTQRGVMLADSVCSRLINQ